VRGRLPNTSREQAFGARQYDLSDRELGQHAAALEAGMSMLRQRRGCAGARGTPIIGVSADIRPGCSKRVGTRSVGVSMAGGRAHSSTQPLQFGEQDGSHLTRGVCLEGPCEEAPGELRVPPFVLRDQQEQSEAERTLARRSSPPTRNGRPGMAQPTADG
jgi:hypothetical protein